MRTFNFQPSPFLLNGQRPLYLSSFIRAASPPLQRNLNIENEGTGQRVDGTVRTRLLGVPVFDFIPHVEIVAYQRKPEPGEMPSPQPGRRKGIADFEGFQPQVGTVA